MTPKFAEFVSVKKQQKNSKKTANLYTCLSLKRHNSFMQLPDNLNFVSVVLLPSNTSY